MSGSLSSAAPSANRGALLKLREAGEELNCSVSTVRRLIAEGELPTYRVGRGLRIAEADIEAFLSAGKR